MSTVRAWRFTNAPPRYDKDDEDKFRASVAQALQVVAGAPAGLTGGSGGVDIYQTHSPATLVAAGVNALVFSADFITAVTQLSPTVQVSITPVAPTPTLSSGVVSAGANPDGTFSVFAFDGRTLSGTSVAGPTPTVTPIYGGFIVDMGVTPPAGFAWDVEWTNSTNGNTGGPSRITSQKMVFVFFSNNASIPFGTSATTFQFKVSQTGNTAAVYGTPSAAQAVSTATAVSANGLIVASQIAVVNLAALSADLGVVTAGLVENAGKTAGIFFGPTAFAAVPPSTWTQGIFFAGANPPPGTVTGAYVDFTATGANHFVHHPKLDLNADGTASFSGNLSITQSFSWTQYGNTYLTAIDSSLAHGMTSIVGTNVAGIIAEESALGTGGIVLAGFAAGNNAGLALDAYQATGGGAANFLFTAWKKSGTGRAALAGTDQLLFLQNGGTVILSILGNGTSFLNGTFSSYLGGSVVTGRHAGVVGVLANLTSASVGEVSLGTISVPASALTSTSSVLRIRARWQWAGSGVQAGLFRIKFGATYVATVATVAASNNPECFIDVDLAYLTNTTQRANAHEVLDNNLGTAVVLLERTSPGETLSNAVTIDFRGTPGGATLTLDSATVEVVVQ